MDIPQLDLEYQVLRRTVHVAGIHVSASEDEIRTVFSDCGEIDKLRLDQASNEPTKMCFIQFADDIGASNALHYGELSYRGRRMRITQSKVTIDVIPPTDAVFGKPMTVGRHVMSVNTQVLRGSAKAKREHSLRDFCEATAKILLRISQQTGHSIPDGSIEELLSTREDSRRGVRTGKTKDEEEWEKEMQK
jgi:hypothetical protein